MPRIIKFDSGKPAPVTDYEHGTLETIAPEQLDDASEADPAAILNQAREEAEQLVREAYAEGMRRGIEAGRQHFDEIIVHAGAVLHEAAKSMKEARESFMDQMGPEISRLVAAIARRILARETQLDPDIICTTARAALERLCDQERVVLRVHPDDLAKLKEERVGLLEEFDGIKNLEIVASEEMSRGGCYAESHALFVDARLEAQLERILEELER